MHFTCSRCRAGAHPWDERLGVRGFVSPQAQRLLCLAGASWSFDRAASHLKEFCGLSVSDNTIRELCCEHGAAMRAWQESAPAVQEGFEQAEGDIEFQTDGTSVNTTEGWREMRLGIFAKRRRGEPATPEEWDERSLPKPETRVVFAGVEKSHSFGARWRRWAGRLGIHDTADITVLADGARWIWDEVAVRFPDAAGVLDIYHAAEHVAATAKVLYGEGNSEAKAWTDAGRMALLHGGWPELKLQIEAARQSTRRPSHRKSLAALETYFERQKDHLGYRRRLAEGRTIGSGQVEGACKQVIGRRLKQTGARWRVRRVNRMASLCCVVSSSHWDTYWAGCASGPP